MSDPRHTLWDASVGVAAALLVFAAVPGVLVTFVGLPLPHHWGRRDVLSWSGLFDALTVVSWCAWAVCVWPILRGAVSRVRSGDLGAAVRLTDRLALRIALGVLALSALFGLGTSAAGASTPPASATAGAPGHVVGSAVSASPARWVGSSATTSSTSTVETGSASRDNGADRRLPDAESTRWVTSGAGDTLASLADLHYGDPAAWQAIASANLGRLMPDDTRFVDPTAVTAGWPLLLPALDDQTRRVARNVGTREPKGTRSASPEAPAPAFLEATSRGGPLGTLLPVAELAGAGVSALVAALLARRSRQLDRLRAFLREEGQSRPAPDEREASLGTFVAPFEQVPLVDIVEAAARLLGDALGASHPTPGRARWLRVGRDGVEVRFDDPVPDDVSGWTRTDQRTWQLPATVDVLALSRRVARGEPWCTALLPLGDDQRGTWLLPVSTGACVAVLGPRAGDLVLAMRAGVETWSWHEALLVTDDGEQVADAVGDDPANWTGAPTRPVLEPPPGPRVLFVGNPDDLPAPVRRACAVLTTHPVDDADVTVLVDGRGASAHPLGLTVHPPLLDASWAGATRALTEPPAAESGAGNVPLLHGRGVTVRVADRKPEPPVGPVPFSWSGSREDSDEAAPAPALSARGEAEVRLLTSLPHIEGLRSDLPAKRARRAVEVVAYLAMHAPDPVTGDRLRTRVLGSADADAAAKTLFNTIGAARRALGAGPGGEPLLPPASRSGHYRVAPSVTADAARATMLLGAGVAARDPAEAVLRVREGLELVEGEPLGGVLTGYAWWRAEGHERRLSDAVVDGACLLVRAALGSGDVDLARWALAQARKVEPYSESITRAAMRVAAASGDAPRLHAEFRECQRQMDELDPGGTLSARTEQLYVLLRAQLAGDGPRPGVLPS